MEQQDLATARAETAHGERAPADDPGEPEAAAGELRPGEQTPEQKRRTLWHTAWGVVLATSTAFSLGYSASRSAVPSIGASRPPAWPLFLSITIVVVSLWFVLAPTLHQWPFDARSEAERDDQAEPAVAELTDADER